MPKALYRDFPYLNNCQADPRLLGYPAILSPFINKTSASREDMHGHHNNQSLVIKGAEFPHLFSGFEYDCGQYEHTTTLRDEDVRIIKLIPRYSSSATMMRTASGMTPSYTVFYQGLTSNKVGYFHIHRHTMGVDGFGYENVLCDLNKLRPDYILSKDEVVCTSPNHKGKKHCAGTNANVIYMSLPETKEDAFMISESFARKLESDAIHRIVIPIRQDVVPINLYGNPMEMPRFLPDIGERVRDDGFLCVFRPLGKLTTAADLDPNQLNVVEVNRDIIFKIKEHNAEIIDLDFCVNMQKEESYRTAYPQIVQYMSLSAIYWQEILNVYEDAKAKGWPITDAFDTLIVKAINRLLAMGQKIKHFSNKKIRAEIEGFNGQPVEYIQVVITYKVPRVVNLAHKLSDRVGS